MPRLKASDVAVLIERMVRFVFENEDVFPHFDWGIAFEFGDLLFDLLTKRSTAEQIIDQLQSQFTPEMILAFNKATGEIFPIKRKKTYKSLK
jgi:hypothetical protein